MLVQEPVQAAVWQCLNHYDYDDALFLAERLYAEVNSDDALYLLATCYYRAGKPSSAYTLLKNKGCSTPQCRYLMAKCCLDVDKPAEAEAALAHSLLSRSKSFDDIATEFGETAPYALALLAKVYRRTERCQKAVECLKRSLKFNSFLWSSYEALCDLGEKVDPARAFQAPTNQQVTTLCRSVFPASPAELKSTTGTPASSVQTPLQQTQQQQALAPSIILSHVEPQSQSLQDSPIAPIVNLLSAQSSPQLFNTPENIDFTSTPDMIIPPPAPRLQRKKQPAAASQLAAVAGGGVGSLAQQKLFPAASAHLPLTPSFGVLPLATPSPMLTPTDTSGGYVITTSPAQLETSYEINKAPAKKPMTRQQQQLTTHNRLPMPAPPVFTQSANVNTNTVRDTHMSSPGLTNVAVRRSSRLFSASSSSVKENNNKPQKPPSKGPKRTKTKTTRSSKTAQELNEINKEKTDVVTSLYSEKTRTPQQQPINVQQQVMSMQKQSAEGLSTLLQQMGRAYQSLASYECHKALEQFSDLPPRHHNTGWVLVQVAKAHFELAQYQKCERAFEEARRLCAHSVDGMEIYSTALWHLQREVQLSTLAQELTDLDKNCPQTWCALGNCFSSQKEHDAAISYLQRAVQVDPEFAYSYRLLGQEYVLTEELDKAMSCFRNAVRVDPRHYGAWYGMGMIYYKQEKFSLAEIHYRKALSINPHSSVILCHVGMAQHALKKGETALQTFDKAIAIDSRNPLCKFHRAHLLVAHDKNKEALSELEELKEIIPKESLVYFLTGKVHKKLGNTHLALMNFSWANDLDPKGANNQIKEAIDKPYHTDDDDPTAGIDSEIDASNDSSMMEADELQLQAIESDESL